MDTQALNPETLPPNYDDVKDDQLSKKFNNVPIQINERMNDNSKNTNIRQQSSNDRIQKITPTTVAQRLLQQYLEKYSNSNSLTFWDIKALLDNELKFYFGEVEVITTQSKNITTTEQVRDETQRNDENVEAAAAAAVACALCLCCTAIIALCAMGSSTSIGSIDGGYSDSSGSGCCICCLCCCDTPQSATRHVTTNRTETVIVKQKRLLVVSLNVCQQIISFYDKDRDSSLSANEFQRFSDDYQRWLLSFELFDSDRKGKISASKLKAVLSACYLNVEDYKVNDFIHKYGDAEGMIWFTEYLVCIIEMMLKK